MVSNVVLTSLIADYLYLSLLSLHFIFTLNHFKNLTQPCCKCCSLSVNIVVNVRFTTSGMCVKNNTLVARTSRNEISTTRDLSQCNSGKLWALAARPFQSQQSGVLTRMWRWCQVQPSQKERAKSAVHSKNVEMLQLLGWRCNEGVVFVCPIHENDERWTCIWI